MNCPFMNEYSGSENEDEERSPLRKVKRRERCSSVDYRVAPVLEDFLSDISSEELDDDYKEMPSFGVLQIQEDDITSPSNVPDGRGYPVEGNVSKEKSAERVLHLRANNSPSLSSLDDFLCDISSESGEENLNDEGSGIFFLKRLRLRANERNKSKETSTENVVEISDDDDQGVSPPGTSTKSLDDIQKEIATGHDHDDSADSNKTPNKRCESSSQ